MTSLRERFASLDAPQKLIAVAAIGLLAIFI